VGEGSSNFVQKHLLSINFHLFSSARQSPSGSTACTCSVPPWRRRRGRNPREEQKRPQRVRQSQREGERERERERERGRQREGRRASSSTYDVASTALPGGLWGGFVRSLGQSFLGFQRHARTHRPSEHMCIRTFPHVSQTALKHITQPFRSGPLGQQQGGPQSPSHPHNLIILSFSFFLIHRQSSQWPL